MFETPPELLDEVWPIASLFAMESHCPSLVQFGVESNQTVILVFSFGFTTIWDWLSSLIGK